MTQEALKLALEALEVSTDWDVNATGKQLKSMQAITALRKALAQTQEPVAWMDVDGKTFPFVWNVSSLGVQQSSKYLDETLTPLYTTTPQRTWVGLTEEERSELVTLHHGWNEYGQAIEAKLKERNFA